MKRLITILMMLLCVSCASAETLRDQTGAPDAVQESWKSTAVPMSILIDAAVEIPETEQAFRVEVTRHKFTPEELERIGSAVIGTTLSGLRYECDYSGWYDSWLCRVKVGDWQLDGSYSILKGRRLRDDVHVLRRSEDIPPSLANSNSIFEQHQARENPYSPEAAQALADELVAAFAPGRIMSAWGTEELIPVSASNQGWTETQTEFVQYPEAYVFCYTPMIGGIPELCAFDDCFMDEDNSYFPFRNDRIYVLIWPDGVSEVRWQSPQDYGSQTPCDLLPFEQIMNVARELLPLKQVAVATRLGDKAGLVVDRITLSYCRVRKRNTKDEYELVPVWDFFGNSARLLNGELHREDAEGEMPYASLLTINAIDGLVIDRSYGY